MHRKTWDREKGDGTNGGRDGPTKSEKTHIGRMLGNDPFGGGDWHPKGRTRKGNKKG